MIAEFVMQVLAEIVFKSAASSPRSFDAEMARYLDQRGFGPAVAKAVPLR